MSYSRFAIYFIPAEGDLADFGAAWLGWDVAAGCESGQLDVVGLRDITMTPMKYGFHGTLKPPFRLADGTTFEQLSDATTQLAASIAPGVCNGLALTSLGGFLALAPFGDVAQLREVAQACVQDLDLFRAPASDAELARRRKAGTHMPTLPGPFRLDQVALCGEREDGRFELIHRYDLTG